RPVLQQTTEARNFFPYVIHHIESRRLPSVPAMGPVVVSMGHRSTGRDSMQAPPTRRRRGRLAWITATLTAGVATVVSGAAFAVPGVTPASVTDEMLPGETETITKSVETPAI